MAVHTIAAPPPRAVGPPELPPPTGLSNALSWAIERAVSLTGRELVLHVGGPAASLGAHPSCLVVHAAGAAGGTPDGPGHAAVLGDGAALPIPHHAAAAAVGSTRLGPHDGAPLDELVRATAPGGLVAVLGRSCRHPALDRARDLAFDRPLLACLHPGTASGHHLADPAALAERLTAHRELECVDLSCHDVTTGVDATAMTVWLTHWRWAQSLTDDERGDIAAEVAASGTVTWRWHLLVADRR